jgi:hypothetical protein
MGDLPYSWVVSYSLVPLSVRWRMSQYVLSGRGGDWRALCNGAAVQLVVCMRCGHAARASGGLGNDKVPTHPRPQHPYRISTGLTPTSRTARLSRPRSRHESRRPAHPHQTTPQRPTDRPSLRGPTRTQPPPPPLQPQRDTPTRGSARERDGRVAQRHLRAAAARQRARSAALILRDSVPRQHSPWAPGPRWYVPRSVMQLAQACLAAYTIPTQLNTCGRASATVARSVAA